MAYPGAKGGGDLLSHFRSTIGAMRLNFSVRDGKRWSPHAIAALMSSGKTRWTEAKLFVRTHTADPLIRARSFVSSWGSRSPGKGRAISTARLPPSPVLHLRPIDVVVCDGPVRRSYLGEGFVLRCFQHLSWPDAATRQCPWRDNRRTGGLSNTVLSY